MMKIRMLSLAFVAAATSAQALQSGDFSYLINTSDTNTVLITGYTGSQGAAEIPSTIDGKTVTGIGINAFQHAPLTHVTIPASVTNIGVQAFAYCTQLTAITVDTNNSYYSHLDGILFNEDQATLIQYPNGKASVEYVVPDSVTHVGDGAFLSCSNLTNIMITGNVTHIGDYVFAICPNLEAITVATNNPSYASVEGILFNKTQSTLIQCPEGKAGSYAIPDSVRYVGGHAFYGCSRLTDVVIGKRMHYMAFFMECSSLRSVTIPHNIGDIFYDTFRNCTNLTSMYFQGNAPSLDRGMLLAPDSNATAYHLLGTSGWSDTLGGCPTALLVMPDLSYRAESGEITITDYTGLDGTAHIPSSFYGLPVSSIQRDAFSGKSNLASVVIPGSVTSIEKQTFEGCASLTNATLSEGISSLGSAAFRNCTNLTSVVIPGSVTSIEKQTFEGCASLTNATLSEGIGSLGSAAFRNCTNLTGVTIPDSMLSIGERAFYGCDITLYTQDNLDYLFSSTSAFLVDAWRASGLVVIPSKVNNLPVRSVNAFYGCDPVTGVIIPSSVGAIGELAFYHCSNLTQVMIPDSVTSIGTSAFKHCPKLSNIILPDSITFLGESSFGFCHGLTDITLPAGVTSIGQQTFEECQNLGRVTIPDSVTWMDYAAFYRCPSLTNATFQGDAPDSPHHPFAVVSDEFVIYFPEGANGFTTPNWKGLPCEEEGVSLVDTHYVDINSATPTSPYTNWTTAATNINDAIHVASNKDTVLVADGVYDSGSTWGDWGNEFRVRIYKDIVVQSLNGPAETIIAGKPDYDHGIACVNVQKGVLSGFTVTRGNTLWSGPRDPTARSGGGLFMWPDAMATHCIIKNNVASGRGGGSWGGTLKNCVITGNESAWEGGGSASGTLISCTLYDNFSSSAGGGAYQCTLTNSTISGNTAYQTGGCENSTLVNCIIWNNEAIHSGTNELYSSSATFSCSPELIHGMDGNITNHPLFISSNDFHLAANSPCVDAGLYIGETTHDLDGTPRPYDGNGDESALFDMGAYEYTPYTVDSDRDGMNDYGELIADTDALDPSDCFMVTLGPTNSVLFNSSATRQYTLYYSTNLMDGIWHPVPNQTAVMGHGGIDRLHDAAATNVARYYKVEVEIP